MLTVYHNARSIRVVLGAHKPHEGSKSYRIAVYGNEATAPAVAVQLALANESDTSVRAAIVRIAGDIASPAPTDEVHSDARPVQFQTLLTA